MPGIKSPKTAVFLFLTMLLAGYAYAAEKPAVYFDARIKTCIGKETVFYAKSDNPAIFNRYTCKWDFGDGTTQEGREVKKVYQLADIYMVKLGLYDDSGALALSAQNRVFVYSPPIAEAGEDKVVCLGDSVLFDGSGSKTTNFIERCFNCNLLDYLWDFGDGSEKVHGVKARHTYKAAGIYKATLVVRDGKNRKCSVDSDTVQVRVNTRPAIVLREVKKACSGSPINLAVFINGSQADDTQRSMLKYSWDFGDGVTQEAGPETSHVYQKGGEYQLSITADDGLATACSKYTYARKIRVNNPPVANPGPNLVCCLNTESVFDASASFDPDGDILTYSWDFGDGATAKGAHATHVYKKRGQYTVTLKVDDNSGTPCSSSTSSFVAIVSDKPVALIDVSK
jgi:PKD repeat protein